MTVLRLACGAWCVSFLLPDDRQARVIGTDQKEVFRQVDYWRRWAKLQTLAVTATITTRGGSHG